MRLKQLPQLQIKHFIFFALSFALVIQVFNTANLYMKISHLEGFEKQFGSYLFALAAEIGILIIIAAGDRSSGAWFALLSFFVGMWFHNYDNPIVVFNINNIQDIQLNLSRHFFSSFLLQTICSLLVYRFSEVYVKISNYKQLITEVSELEQKKSELKQLVTGFEDKQALAKVEKELLSESIESLKKTEAQLSEQVSKLKKQKAGLSTHYATE